MKTAKEWFNMITEGLPHRPIELEDIVAIQTDAKATGRAEGLREAADKCDELKRQPGVSTMSAQAIMCDMCKVEILAAIDRKEGVTE